MCVAYGCSNASKDGFNLFLFPSNIKICNLWTKEVQKMRADFKQPSNYSCLCNALFSRDVFDASCLLANEMGISKTMRLPADAVPTIVKPGGHVNSYEMESFNPMHPAMVKRRRKQNRKKNFSLVY